MGQVKKTRLYEEIVKRILSMMQAGIFKPGDRLPAERILAEEYGVSRTAVREAMRSLELMGYVESRVGEGTYVTVPCMEQVVEPFSMMVSQDTRLSAELIEVRLILETEIAMLAARRITDEQLAVLRTSLVDMEADILSGGLGVQADEQFHSTLVQAANNSALNIVLDMCSGMLSSTREVTQRLKGVPEKTLKDHRLIYEAVEARDEKKARRLMRQHLMRALSNLDRVKN